MVAGPESGRPAETRPGRWPAQRSAPRTEPPEGTAGRWAVLRGAVSGGRGGGVSGPSRQRDAGSPAGVTPRSRPRLRTPPGRGRADAWRAPVCVSGLPASDPFARRRPFQGVALRASSSWPRAAARQSCARSEKATGDPESETRESMGIFLILTPQRFLSLKILQSELPSILQLHCKCAY